MQRASIVHVLSDTAEGWRGLAARLANCGFSVRRVTSIGEVHAFAADATPEALFVRADLDDDGVLDIVARARAVAVPVVLVADASGDVLLAAAAMRAGAVDVVAPSTPPGRLRECMARAVDTASHWRRERERREHARGLLGRLTPRERAVLDHLLAGRVNKQIAGVLGCEVATVKVHRSRLMRKLGVRSPFGLFEIVRSGCLAEPGEAPPQAVRTAPAAEPRPWQAARPRMVVPEY